jgi:osmotically-inducible protein OsmY
MLTLITCLLPGCAFMAGAAGGVAIGNDSRSPGTILEDETIENTATRLIYQDKQLENKIHVNVTSYNHVMLITGEVLSKALRERVIDIVRNVKNVRRVHNELAIASLASFESRSNDTLITSKIKTKMLGTRYLKALRIKVVTENASVYLMGIVPPEQADMAAEVARNISGVKRVVKLFEYLQQPVINNNQPI